MLGTITFVLILLFLLIIVILGTAPKPKGFIWWIKVFVLYLALMIASAFLWLFSLPLYIGLRRLPPFAIIKPIHGALTQIMMWLLPIGLVIAIVCYLIYRVLKPIIQGITLGIVDISGYTPFREFIETGVFEFVENLLSLNLPGIWRSGLKIMMRTPQYAREVFSSEIDTATRLVKSGEQAARDKVNAEKRALEAKIKAQSIEITDLMTDAEKAAAMKENERIRQDLTAQSTAQGAINADSIGATSLMTDAERRKQAELDKLESKKPTLTREEAESKIQQTSIQGVQFQSKVDKKIGNTDIMNLPQEAANRTSKESLQREANERTRDQQAALRDQSNRLTDKDALMEEASQRGNTGALSTTIASQQSRVSL